MIPPTPPIRVLHVYKTWSPDSFGGVGEMITTLAEAGPSQGVINRVLYLGKTDKPSLVRHAGIRGICLPLNFEIQSAGFSWDLPAALRKFSLWCDILHFHFPWPLGDLAFLLSGIKKPYVVTYHADIVRQRCLKVFYTPLRRHFLEGAARIIATSPNYVQTSSILKTCKRPIDIIPIGLPDSSQAPMDLFRKVYWREKLGYGFVLFLGALRYYKGLHLLLRAARFIDGTIVIAGSGALEQKLRAIVRKNNISNVKFVGLVTQEDKAILYHLSAVFAFPSHLRSEAFGLALVEASLWGKPMVSSEIGSGTSYINAHEETGLVVPPNNSIALAAAINELLANKKRRQQLGQGARERYERLFTVSDMGRSYREIYEAALRCQDNKRSSRLRVNS